MLSQFPELPVSEVLPDLIAALTDSHQAVLQAPPGAGKTTLVPLVLAGEDWLGHQKILMLEPRRLATRGAASRMADMLGEKPGQTVGYRMRLETRVSEYTKIEVITEGILTRMLQQDPSLEGVGLVIFDEFHERSLDADLALALTLKGREMFRDEDPLRVLVMSATLDGDAVATLLDAPLISSEGRQYPVEVHYGRASQPRDRLEDKVLPVVRSALKAHPASSQLVFLPGEGEIRRVETALKDLPGGLPKDLAAGVQVAPLFGNLSMDAQQVAIRPPPAGQRKIVLATNIAETSLTIEGVDVVIDSGLARVPAFDPNTAMTRLETRRISKASAEQRRGRAGRLAPGHCYRLWSRDQQQQLASHDAPEILGADLAPLALQLINWGVNRPDELDWLDVPPPGAWQQAIDLLAMLGVINQAPEGFQLTDHGEQVAMMPTHPRLAHMLVRGAEAGFADEACLLAAVLSDRDPFSSDTPDLSVRLDILQGRERCPPGHRGWQQRTLKLAGQLKNSLPRSIGQEIILPEDQGPGYLIATAYPDRVARRRHKGGYQLANGRGADIDRSSRLSRESWLAVAETGGMKGRKGDQIRSAAPLSEALFEGPLSSLVHTSSTADWDEKSGRFVAEKRRQIGSLVLSREALADVPESLRIKSLMDVVSQSALKVLPWTPELEQWQMRVMLVREHLAPDWPDVSTAGLLADMDTWLAPDLSDVRKQSDFRKLDLSSMLHSLLTWEQQQFLDRHAPSRLQVPSGSSHKIDYRESPPVLAVKLQEMFGCESAPAIVEGRVPLVIHLLSPAGRPLQVTSDLASFWRQGYEDVKKEMKGRYPKHPWPDDPLQATPTAKTRRKS